MRIEIEIPDEVALACEGVGLTLTQVIADRLFWAFTRRVMSEGIEFWAEMLSNWIWENEADAWEASERFEEAAVNANVAGKTQFLYTAEPVETNEGCWRVRVECCDGAQWRAVHYIRGRRSRLTTACTHVAKIVMIFEATRLCYDASWMPRDPEIIPDSPPLIIRPETLQLAIDHVEECFKASDSLDAVANRGRIAEEAEVLLEKIRIEFNSLAKNGSIILTRTQLTGKYAHHRWRGMSVDDLYLRQIPYLIKLGQARALDKEGKLERYAFRTP